MTKIETEVLWLCSLPLEGKIRFLAGMSFQITAAGRASNEARTEDLMKPRLLRRINETQHRVTSGLNHLLTPTGKMKKINFQKIALPVLLGLGVTFLFATSAAAQEPENLKLATRLVEKAQLHKMAALGMHLSVRRAVAEGKAAQSFLECVSAKDPSVFSRQIASVYAEGLSVSEMKDALSFFDSAGGQKYIAYTFHGTEKYAGFTPSTPPTTVTIDEKKSIEAFVSSAVGKQMSGAASPLAISSQREIAKVVEPILANCRN